MGFLRDQFDCAQIEEQNMIDAAYEVTNRFETLAQKYDPRHVESSHECVSANKWRDGKDKLFKMLNNQMPLGHFEAEMWRAYAASRAAFESFKNVCHLCRLPTDYNRLLTICFEELNLGGNLSSPNAVANGRAAFDALKQYDGLCDQALEY